MKLFLQANLKFFAGVILFAAILFISAGTFQYWNAWLMIGLLFLPMYIAGLCLMIKNPSLLQSRLDAKESQKEQKMVILLSGLMFIGGFILCGLDFRYGWSHIPIFIVISVAVIFLSAYAMYAEVLRENTFLSRTIQVQENQTVVDTGLYGIVRHPMYTATLCLFLTMPLILGSLYGFLIFLIYPFIIIVRIKNEENVLVKELNGYTEYMKKVPYRLIPYIW